MTQSTYYQRLLDSPMDLLCLHVWGGSQKRAFELASQVTLMLYIKVLAPQGGV